MKKLSILITFLILNIACGVVGPKTFTVVQNGQDLKFATKSAAASFRPDLREGQISLANYENAYDKDSVMGGKGPENDDQVKVNFYFTSNNEADRNNSVKAGDVSGQITMVSLNRGYQGLNSTNFGQNRKVEGKLVITEVTDTTIKGEIDVKKADATKGESRISGPFEAKILSKKL